LEFSLNVEILFFLGCYNFSEKSSKYTLALFVPNPIVPDEFTNSLLIKSMNIGISPSEDFNYNVNFGPINLTFISYQN